MKHCCPLVIDYAELTFLVSEHEHIFMLLVIGALNIPVEHTFCEVIYITLHFIN